jgi:hypothetical protein
VSVEVAIMANKEPEGMLVMVDELCASAKPK